MAFAYELLYSTITLCTRFAATTTVSMAIGEAIALNCKFYCSLCMARFLDNVETPKKKRNYSTTYYLFPLLLNKKSISHNQINSKDSLLAS